MRDMQNPNSFDEYLQKFPKISQDILIQMYELISKIVPEASFCFNYGIPTFKLNGNLVHFAAYKKHIGFYPSPSGITKFAKELSLYKTSKGTVQFPTDSKIPYELIEKIVLFRVKENLQK
jgi:uncharacterized protein YdhG (YjbR/CyaY superfamily)